MRLRTPLAALFVLALVFSGCGDDDDGGDTSAGSTEAPDTSGDDGTDGSDSSESSDSIGDDSEIGSAAIKVTESDLGPILTTQDGFTLYAYTNDTEGEPTCEGQCAATWPPMLLEAVPEVEGVDDGVLSIVEGPDGNQLKAGDSPLYLYVGDGAAGDTAGQGLGGVWFVVAPDGTLIQDS